jgi:hypothetical protein
MAEEFEKSDVLAVSQAMRTYIQRCEILVDLIGEKRRLTASERMEVEGQYRSLKEDLKLAAKYGTIDNTRRTKTRTEDCFYDPAVRKAAIDLQPATNSNPITSHWLSAVIEAQSEFTYYLDSLERACQAD